MWDVVLKWHPKVFGWNPAPVSCFCRLETNCYLVISLPARSSVITPICIILTSVVAAVLVVLICFLSTPGFLSCWIESPDGQHELRRLCFWQHFRVMLQASLSALSPLVFLALVWPSSLPSVPSLCQALGTVEFRSTDSTCLFHSWKSCLHL